jgi:hypothetical protein
MARGIAELMGFRLMLNFNNPYTATGLGDFWNRWHISLSTWFKDYLYFPLGGSRHGKFRTYINMFVTMIVSGIWHGAAWTFVVWGGLHALGRCLTRELEQTEFYQERIPRLSKQLAVFTFVTFTWIFFRAQSLTDAGLIISGSSRPAGRTHISGSAMAMLVGRMVRPALLPTGRAGGDQDRRAPCSGPGSLMMCTWRRQLASAKQFIYTSSDRRRAQESTMGGTGSEHRANGPSSRQGARSPSMASAPARRAVARLSGYSRS